MAFFGNFLNHNMAELRRANKAHDKLESIQSTDLCRELRWNKIAPVSRSNTWTSHERSCQAPAINFFKSHHGKARHHLYWVVDNH